VVDASNPRGLLQFKDVNANGDLYDDSYLRDTRLKAMPHPEATQRIDRYSVIVPPSTEGPVAISAAVYYQSLEAIVASKFLGNIADQNGDLVLQTCVLGGPCDGRRPETEPPVVEGAPPVPMIVRSWVMAVDEGTSDMTPPAVLPYPPPGAEHVYQDVVPKAFFTEPVRGVDARTFTVSDSHGIPVRASVDAIGVGAWGLFPDQVLLKGGETYVARLKPGVCDFFGNCTSTEVVWKFTVAPAAERASGDTSIPNRFLRPTETVRSFNPRKATPKAAMPSGR
jgi:hypothetical protein